MTLLTPQRTFVSQETKGGWVAQRKHSGFSPSSQGFESWLHRDLLLSWWTALRFAKQWISQMQLAVAYRAKSTEKTKKQSYFCCFHIPSNSSQKHLGEVQLGSNWGPCPYISLFRKVVISLTNVSHHQLLVLINSDQCVCPLTSLNNLVVIYCHHKYF